MITLCYVKVPYVTLCYHNIPYLTYPPYLLYLLYIIFNMHHIHYPNIIYARGFFFFYCAI